MQETDEVLDLVDKDDNVIGKIRRGDYQKLVDQKLGYIRAVDIFMQNDQGKLWIPRRTAHKTIAPNGLDYSAGGHVSSGETYLQAALKEIKEELRINLAEKDLKFIKKFRATELRYFRSVYLFHHNEVPSYNPDDFVEYYWLSPQELLEKLEAGEPAKSSIKESVLFLMKTTST